MWLLSFAEQRASEGKGDRRQGFKVSGFSDIHYIENDVVSTLFFYIIVPTLFIEIRNRLFLTMIFLV
jgi:hypothetical protein